MFLSSSTIADFSKIAEDTKYLLRCFIEVLQDLGEGKIASLIPWEEFGSTSTSREEHEGTSACGESWLRSDADWEKLTQAYSIVFQLLNMVEENAVIQYRRHLERLGHIENFSGLWDQVLTHLQERGFSEEEIARALSRIRVEPVLTAHPTEAKRFTVLEQHREIYLLLVKRENPMWTPQEQEEIRESVKVVLERLWRTGEIYLEKPDVASEVRNVIYYLRYVFPNVLQSVDSRLRVSWSKCGFQPHSISSSEKLPKISFGSWVGGDRDGHPLVHASVTSETLATMRTEALSLLRERLSLLAQQLSLSVHQQGVPKGLLSRLQQLVVEVGPSSERILKRNPDEPWRQFVSLLIAKLPSRTLLTASNRENKLSTIVPICYRLSDELKADLVVLQDALESIGAHKIVSASIVPLIRILDTFGFHLASLDIRQNSGVYERAATQILQAAGLSSWSYDSWDEMERIEFLHNELKQSRPFLLPGQPVGEDAAQVLDCFRVLAAHLDAFGKAGIGSLIVSMTRSVSDLLVVYLLARESGLVLPTASGLISRLQVVPLFETITDLERAPEILREFLSHPVTSRSAQVAAGSSQPVQQVMIGYSDSNKDGGITASLWSLSKAQLRLSAVAKELGIRIRFFHGRGGSISRGAGPIHRFIKALPAETLQGDLRLTEQGEVIARQYANTMTATHNIELLLASTLGSTVASQEDNQELPEARHALDQLTEISRTTYRELLEHIHFLPFYREATPIDVIERSKIGSRPSRRTGKSGLADLRAIPWVFSWSQARFCLSGWYGFGSAMEELEVRCRNDFDQLRRLTFTWPTLHYMVSSIATNFMLTDLEIMGQYASLVSSLDCRTACMAQILSEHERTTHYLELCYEGSLRDKRPHVEQAISLRRKPLRLLHKQQCQLLSAWRKLDEEERATHPTLKHLLLTVNAIANGLGTTG